MGGNKCSIFRARMDRRSDRSQITLPPPHSRPIPPSGTINNISMEGQIAYSCPGLIPLGGMGDFQSLDEVSQKDTFFSMQCLARRSFFVRDTCSRSVNGGINNNGGYKDSRKRKRFLCVTHWIEDQGPSTDMLSMILSALDARPRHVSSHQMEIN